MISATNERPIKMKNSLPGKVNQLFSKADDNAAGYRAHESAIQLKHNRETDVLGDLGSARTAETTYQDGKAGKLNATKARRTADKNARAFILVARQVLEKKLGSQWSQAWAGAGFVDGSFRVPDTIAERTSLTLRLKDYLTLHPDYESDQMGVTAGKANELYEALRNSNAAVNACAVDLGFKKGLRNDALKKLRKRMRGLNRELGQVLAGDDPRWNGFGLNMPDAVGLPGVPENLVATGAGPRHLLAKWDPSPLGVRYRVFRKIIGVDADFVLVKTTTETETDLNTFTSGQVVRVRVAAVNADGGVSLLCDFVEQTVP
jgi:hypothetical protein